MNSFKVGVIGCGLIGARRLEAIQSTKLGVGHQIFDIDPSRARNVAEKFQCSVAESADALLNNPEISVVIVSTANVALAPFTQRALELGKHVLVEKPAAISIREISAMNGVRTEALCKVGYNHRFHPAALQLKEFLNRENDSIFWIRAAYGHGGRPGYEKEWRFNPELSGGGELIDQGVHLLDLGQFFLGENFQHLGSARQNAFYRSAVEDNAFALLKTEKGVHFQLHCSVTQWKNLFRFEINTESKLYVWEGLGGSYGEEKLLVYSRNKAGGVPQFENVDLSSLPTNSWEAEWRHFVSAMQSRQNPLWSSIQDSQALFAVLDKIYQDEICSR